MHDAVETVDVRPDALVHGGQVRLLGDVQRCRPGESGEDLDLPVGSGDWAEGKWPNIFGADTTMMSAGGWSDGVFTAQLRMVSTPHLMLVTVDPAAGEFRASWRELLLHGNDPAHYPG